MKTITLSRQTVLAAANARGVTACEEIDRLLSASFGYKVCSHLKSEDELRDRMTFSFGSRCIHTRPKE